MQVTLETDEISLVRDLLRLRAQDLWTEVRRADDPQFHDELREMRERVQALLTKLEETVQAHASSAENF